MATALITGASGGIGLEFAKLFAQRKVNLVLIARNEKRLTEIAEKFTRSGIHVTIYPKDLSVLKNAEEIYNDLKNKNVAIDYLVNNAGFGLHGSLTETSWQRELEMINLNMVTLTYLTKMFAADMKGKGSGNILNVASTGSFQPGPFMAVYCATKAYVLSLSEALNAELKGSGVVVSTLCPGVTDTGFHAIADTANTTLLKRSNHASAKEVAEYGYKIIMKRKSVGVHGLMNRAMVFSLRFTPRDSVTGIARLLMKKK
jgi:short-subunit dehydrogenase